MMGKCEYCISKKSLLSFFLQTFDDEHKCKKRKDRKIERSQLAIYFPKVCAPPSCTKFKFSRSKFFPLSSNTIWKLTCLCIH